MTDFITAPLNAPMDAPRNGLEQIIEAAMADPKHWRAFEQMLPTVDLYIAPDGETLKAVEPGASGMRTLRPDQEIMDVKGVTLDDGRVAAGVFTDPSRLRQQWGEDTVFIAMNAREVLKLFRDGPIILNVGSPRVMLFQKDDIESLLAAAVQAEGQRQTGGASTGTVQLSNPAITPTVLVERLTGAFGPVGGSGVTAAWLARAVWVEADRAGWYLDVRTARPMDEVRAMVQRAVTGVSFGQETLDIAIEAPGAKDGVGIRIV
jgi:hypothetical protein